MTNVTLNISNEKPTIELDLTNWNPGVDSKYNVEIVLNGNYRVNMNDNQIIGVFMTFANANHETTDYTSRKIHMIKHLRGMLNIGLKEAKDLSEILLRDKNALVASVAVKVYLPTWLNDDVSWFLSKR